MTTTTTAVERTAAPARLERHRDACTETDAPLDVFLGYLRELANADLDALAPDTGDRDVARAVALGHLQGALKALTLHMTSRFSADVRSAPPSGLAAVVEDARVPCKNTLCASSRLPWDSGDRFCDDRCETADMRERGA